MHAWIIWAVITLVALLIEIITLGFAVICFAVGALVACLIAFVGLDLVWQLSAFSFATIVSLVVARPLVLRHLKRSKDRIETNTNALIGRKGVVTQPFNGGVGRVSVYGDDWKAEIEGDSEGIKVGDSVEIIRVESVVLIVKKR